MPTEMADVVFTSRVPVGDHWLVTGYGTADADTYIPKYGFNKVLHCVYVNGRSTTVAQNTTSVIINSSDGTEDSDPGHTWFNNATGVVVDFCVIGR